MSGSRVVDRTKFLKGLLVLLLAPFLVLALFAVYVYVANSRPQGGALRTRIEPAVVLPGMESTYFLDFNGEAEKEEAPPPPVDVAFLIDVSGSMTASLPAMANAAHQVAQELASESPGRIRFSLIRFDTEAEINTPWTADPEQLYEGLKKLQAFTGGNDTRKAFVKLDELRRQVRSGAKLVAIFYTDGVLEACGNPIFCPDGVMTEAEMKKKAAELRSAGVEIYSIGLPTFGSAPLMIEMTGSPARVFDPVDARDLAANFRLAARKIAGGSNEGGQLTHRIDGRYFSAPLEGTSWAVDPVGTLVLPVGQLPQLTATFAHPLVAHSSGLWRVGVEPPRLVFADKNGKLVNLNAQYRPLLLVVGWGALLWMLLPAALWSLVSLTRRTREVLPREIPPPAIPRLRPPTLLPALPLGDEGREAPVPTLFIGLGGAGRRALHALRAEAKQSHLSRHSQFYQFLWIDLDQKEADRPTPFEAWDDYPIEPQALLAPPDIRRTHTYLPQPGQSPEHLKWFDAQRYFNISREELNLAGGARGDRMLARLAFFKWLTLSDGLLSALDKLCKELVQVDSADGTRQIVVLASPDGGVGSGFLIDLGRLLRRMTRRRQQAEGGFAPEIIGVLCETTQSARAENRGALEMELESAVLSGAFPQRVTYASGDELLDGVDTESPYNWVFKTSAFDPDSSAAQGAELGAVLVERHPRAALLEASDSLKPRRLVEARTNAVHILPAQLYDEVHDQLFLRMIGPDILLDIEPSDRGGFAPKVVSAETAARHLANWSEAGTPGTALQLLLSAASDTAHEQSFLMAMQASPPPDNEWFLNAFSVAVTTRLHGRIDADTGHWERDWMPGDAAATLGLLATQLENSVRPKAQSAGAGRGVEIVDYVAGLARTASDQLKAWVADFCLIAERASRRRSEFDRIRNRLSKISGRIYLSPPVEHERIERWTREIFETWLGTPDVTTAVRERLFFSASLAGGSLQIALNFYVGSVRVFATAEAAAAAIDQHARSLARIAPASRIGGRLVRETAAGRRQVARDLVETTTAPRQVLVVAPDATRWNSGEAEVLEEFRQQIPQPPTHGNRRDALGDDHSAVRRVELTETMLTGDGQTPEQLPFVVVAEQEAELLRRRAEKLYSLAVAVFPPELRIALAYPERFLSFVRAYKAGRIVLREDAAGAKQWLFLDTVEFLTFGAEPTLAQAAANYVWYVTTPPQQFAQAGEGSFAKLEQWRQRRDAPDDDVLTLIAIDVYED